MPICEVTGEDVPSLDEHHVIPREYGGLNGPTVKISPNLHQAIHRAAGSDKKTSELLAHYSPKVASVIAGLVHAIREAQKLNGDGIFVTKVTVDFKDDYAKLKKLAEEMNCTIAEVVRRLVHNLLTR